MMDIRIDPDMSIEPGHQVIVLPDTTEGAALAILLNEQERPFTLTIPHTAGVDQRIVDLINTLAQIRYSAPGLVQLELAEGTGETE